MVSALCLYHLVNKNGVRNGTDSSGDVFFNTGGVSWAIYTLSLLFSIFTCTHSGCNAFYFLLYQLSVWAILTYHPLLCYILVAWDC